MSREGGEEREKTTHKRLKITTMLNFERISVWANHSLDIEDFSSGIVGPPPGRAEEHNICLQVGSQHHEVSAHKFYLICHAVHLSVVACKVELLRIDINSNHCKRTSANAQVSVNCECHLTIKRTFQKDGVLPRPPDTSHTYTVVR